ncbi:MAG: MFS transporter [Solirubrobacterales bacterium]
MTGSRTRKILFLSVIIQVVLVLGFTGALNVSSFKANYTKSLVASFAVAGSDTVRNIEYAVKYGKPLDNFYGMEKLLATAKSNSPNISDALVCSPDGRIMYGLSGKVQGKKLDPELIGGVRAGADKDQKYSLVQLNDKYHVFLPLHDRESKVIGSLDLVFDQDVVTKKTAVPLNQTSQYLALIALLTIAALALAVLKINIFDEHGEVMKTRFLVIILSILSVAQLTYAGLNFRMYSQVYVDIAKENTTLTAHIIQKDINDIVAKGVRYDELNGIEEWMKNIIKSVPEIGRIYITDQQGRALYRTDTTAEVSQIEKSPYDYGLPLVSDSAGQNAQVKASINISLSQKYVKEKALNLGLDALTVLIISFFFMVEITIFVLLILRRETSGRAVAEHGDAATPMEANPHTDVIRPLAFLFFIAASMSVSYIPLMMKDLYQPILGLPKNIVLGLPLSMELFCVSLSIVITGYLVEKRGWRSSFYLGLAVLAIGLVLSGLAWNGIVFVLARGVAGFGYGFCWMAMRSFCTSAPTILEKTEGLSAYNAGVFAGFNCGIALGSMLAERIGFGNVFFVAFGALAITLLVALQIIGRDHGVIPQPSTAAPASHGSWGQVARFLTNPKVMVFFLLVTLPLAVCAMFLDYFFPLFGASVGLSPSNIGRGFLLYGLSVVYLGPILSTFAEKTLGTRQGVLVAAFLVATSLVVFGEYGTLVAALGTIMILSFADSFGLVAENNYFVTLKATQDLGETKALGYYSMLRKLGQTAGPFVFGGLAILGPALSVEAIGLVMLVLVLLFLFLTRNDAPIEEEANR